MKWAKIVISSRFYINGELSKTLKNPKKFNLLQKYCHSCNTR